MAQFVYSFDSSSLVKSILKKGNQKFALALSKNLKILHNVIFGYMVLIPHHEVVSEGTEDRLPHVHTYIHTLLHSSPLGALPPYIHELK